MTGLRRRLAVVLSLLLLAIAAWTIAARQTFAAVVGFVAYGLLLSIAWVALSAIDVALTEAAIGGGLTGVLLIGAAARLRAAEAAGVSGASGDGAAMARRADIGGGGRGDCSRRPLAARSRPHSCAGGRRNLSVTGVGNPVTAVLLAYRALDTLLESIVVVFALIGVWSLAPDHVWGGRPGPLHHADPDGVLSISRGCYRPSGSSSASTFSGLGRIFPAASSRAPRSWQPCGCWS